MVETLITVIGGMLGGLFRLAPEVLNLLDRRNERAHERAMFDKQLEADRQRAGQQLEQTKTEGQFTLDGKGLDALIAAIRAQGKSTGVRWVDALNASVRPVLTYWWALILYTVVLICQFVLLLQAGVPGTEAVLKLWGPEEKALVASLFTFWFLDRVLRHRQGG